jgi:hypothetical protein
MAEKTPEEQLRTLLATRTAALIQGDIATLKQLLADDFVYTNASGLVFDKTTYLDFYITSGNMHWQAQDLDDLHLRLYGTAAILTCRIHDRATFQGNEFDAYFRSTQVFIMQNGRWQYTAGHTTSLQP